MIKQFRLYFNFLYIFWNERDFLSCYVMKMLQVNIWYELYIIVIKIMKILALSVLIALCLLQMANSADPKNPIWADHFTQTFT
jgi:hypothetical protein